MEIMDVRTAKNDLENAIAKAVSDYEFDTGTKVEFIHIQRRQRYDAEMVSSTEKISITVTANI